MRAVFIGGTAIENLISSPLRTTAHPLCLPLTHPENSARAAQVARNRAITVCAHSTSHIGQAKYDKPHNAATPLPITERMPPPGSNAPHPDGSGIHFTKSNFIDRLADSAKPGQHKGQDQKKDDPSGRLLVALHHILTGLAKRHGLLTGREPRACARFRSGSACADESTSASVRPVRLPR